MMNKKTNVEQRHTADYASLIRPTHTENIFRKNRKIN